MAWLSPPTERAEFASAQESGNARLGDKKQIPIPHHGRQQLIVKPVEPEPRRASICTGGSGLTIFQGRSEDEEYGNVPHLPFQGGTGETEASHTERTYSRRCPRSAEY